MPNSKTIYLLSCLGVLALLVVSTASLAQDKFEFRDPSRVIPSTQQFWNTENKIELSIFAGQLAIDAITTQQGLERGFKEANPLMRPLVQRGVAGQTVASVVSLAAALGTMYFLHSTHHSRFEHITMRLILAGEGAIVTHNISLMRGAQHAQ
jgi:hypothetical protein